ncbi:putative DDB1- and CUL4-associated factor 13 [Apostichopus japonicus]|uniref:DDB1- and CUL4-associated factor 13 n=1 Tax=Stichopus japonicus TaxID=307972 RepID=A0A2G8JCP1_STIJA|nr:putative DDB1- and CUL4-associated factor 13 [Apostichopus japonicus]
MNIKVKVLSRNPDDYLRETKHDIHRLPRNYDPTLHPFEANREYTRALNATKLDRIFAKPFLGALDGHSDSVQCMSKHPKSLSTLLSGSCDGQVKVWNLATRKCVRTLNAHRGFVRGITVDRNCEYILTVGNDQTIKQWGMEPAASRELEEPVNTIIGKVSTVDIVNVTTKSQRYLHRSITTGRILCMLPAANRLTSGYIKADPVRSFTWGTDSIQSFKFNPVETNILASCTQDRHIVLYDTREVTPLRKLTLAMRTNTVAWNPMEAFIFTAANEDYQLYTFDMRRLDEAICVHRDHVSAVIDVDYSPTGKEFVTGSFDKSIRIFPTTESRSRYILCGSDEMNIRIWKASASEKLGKLDKREESTVEYSNKLREKFAHHPQVRRIARHRHVPRSIYHETKIIKEQLTSRKRKETNRRKNNKPESIPVVPIKKKAIVGEVE